MSTLSIYRLGPPHAPAANKNKSWRSPKTLIKSLNPVGTTDLCTLVFPLFLVASAQRAQQVNLIRNSCLRGWLQGFREQRLGSPVLFVLSFTVRDAAPFATRTRPPTQADVDQAKAKFGQRRSVCFFRWIFKVCYSAVAVWLAALRPCPSMAHG